MKRPARQRGPVAPLNVRLVIDGREYPCDVLRDADGDANGYFAWVAVPREELPETRSQEVINVLASMIPPRTILIARVPPPP